MSKACASCVRRPLLRELLRVFCGMFVASAPPSKRRGPRGRVEVVHAQTPCRLSVDYLSRFLADILFVCHLLTSLSLVVFVTPCDISWLKPFHDESRKDLSSIRCRKYGFVVFGACQTTHDAFGSSSVGHRRSLSFYPSLRVPENIRIFASSVLVPQLQSQSSFASQRRKHMHQIVSSMCQPGTLFLHRV